MPLPTSPKRPATRSNPPHSSASASHLDIGIAGAGLLGRLLAWKLLKQGHRISLFDAGPIEHSAKTPSPAAAFTAAGMVAPLSEAVISERAIYTLGLHSLQLWPKWLQELEQKTIEQSDYFFQRGSLAIAHPQDIAELKQFERDLQHTTKTSHGSLACDSSVIKKLNAQQIQNLEPDLDHSFQQALYLQTEAHINNRQLLNRLSEEIIALGGKLYPNTQVTISTQKIIDKQQTFKFDWALDCRGFGAKQDLNTQLRGVRGEVLSVQTQEIQLQRPVRLMHPRYQLYIVPKPHNIFIIGATSIESEDMSPMSLQSNLELASALYTLNPAFAEARVIDIAVNLRPACMNNMPHIECKTGLIRANGLYRHGYLLAPSMVEHILNLIQEIETSPYQKILSTQDNIQHA